MRQVLNNKLEFQSGPKPVTLGQFPCGAFQFTRDIHAVPLFLCSNDFKYTVADGLEPEDADLIGKNDIVASLEEKAKTWYQE